MPTIEKRQSQGKEREIMECVKESSLYGFPYPKKAITYQLSDGIKAETDSLCLFREKSRVGDFRILLDHPAGLLAALEVSRHDLADRYGRSISSGRLIFAQGSVSVSRPKPRSSSSMSWRSLLSRSARGTFGAMNLKYSSITRSASRSRLRLASRTLKIAIDSSGVFSTMEK